MRHGHDSGWELATQQTATSEGHSEETVLKIFSVIVDYQIMWLKATVFVVILSFRTSPLFSFLPPTMPTCISYISGRTVRHTSYFISISFWLQLGFTAQIKHWRVADISCLYNNPVRLFCIILSFFFFLFSFHCFFPLISFFFIPSCGLKVNQASLPDFSKNTFFCLRDFRDKSGGVLKLRHIPICSFIS